MTTMDKYNSTYMGIVIQNNDPEFRGRCKIWVPHVSVSVYEKVNKLKANKVFKVPGKNMGDFLDASMMKELKEVLPWSEYCSPIMGGNGSYNTYDDHFTISDSNVHEYRKIPKEEPSEEEKTKKYKLNSDNIGEKPSRIFESMKETRPSDAFSNSGESFSNNYNQLGYNYSPSSYSNSSKGLFSIPNVGSHVWVQFREGNPLYPIYIGMAFSQHDWNSIFKTVEDYPSTYENISKNSKDGKDFRDDHNKEIYRNKMVLNQKGGAIEIVNTDNREKLKFTHYSGAFLEFNNRTGVQFYPNNFQRLVLENEFDTIRGFKNSFVERDWDCIVKGDMYLKVGKFAYEYHRQWYTIAKSLNDIKKQLNSSLSDISSFVDGKFEELANIEKNMGMGGSHIINIAKHKIENIGLVFNDLTSYKIDEESKIIDYKVVVNDSNAATFEVQTIARPLVKYVHIDDFPGGNYTLNVCGKYNLIVGSGGINMKTTGHIDISGSILNILGQQINIASPNNVHIDGGQLVSIIADTLTVKHRGEDKQIFLDQDVGIKRNLDVGNNVNVHKDVIVGQNVVIEGNLTVKGEFIANNVSHTVSIESIPATSGHLGGTHIHNGQTWTLKFND